MTDRYLGSGTVPIDVSGPTGTIPSHLPERLAITLWDFSWYTQAGAGQPYADLDAAVADAASLGYNAIRICAAPLLLSHSLGLADLAQDLPIEGLGASPTGGFYGQRTRWYDAPGGFRINVRERLDRLFRAAERNNMVILLASWEYQQSPAFSADPRWFETIDSVSLADRYDALAAAWQDLIGWLSDRGHRHRIAMVEMHNEVDFSILPDLAGERARAAVADLRDAHPDLLITASYGKPPHLAMHRVPAELGAAQFHVYSYGVLDELQKRIDIRSEGTEGFPNEALQSLLRDDAPSFAEYGCPAEWKLRATVVTDQMVYGYDWVDPRAWDAWLNEHYPAFAAVMHREIESRVIAVAEWARWRSVPAVIGEGWIGYTPRDGSFEEGETGRALAEHGIRTALAHGVWGVVLSSNAAPHHPMWQQRDWQARVNAEILST